MDKVVLSSIIDLISGGTPKTSHPEYWENGNIGWLSVNDFNNNDRFVYDSEKKITQEGVKNSSTKYLECGDIIISARGTVGALAQIGTPMCFNQSCFGIRAKKDKTTNDYLYYALKNYVKNIQRKGQGSVFNTINLASFDLMEIEIPKDVTEQQKIASVLSSLDKKIELNNKINKELEAIAKTLYDYWFVQFDFPDNNGKPYKSSGGAMVYNEELKREIPDGWEVANLKNNPLTKILKPKIDNFEGNKIYLATADIQNKNINFNAEIISYDNRPSRANMQPIANSIWFAKMKNSKKILLLSDYSEIFLNNYILSTGFMGLECKKEALEYLWGFVDNDYFETIKDKLANGATQEAINNDDLVFIKLLIPSDNVLKKYHLQMKSIYQKIYNNQIQNQELSTLRDWLLPMLMNGQVKVK